MSANEPPRLPVEASGLHAARAPQPEVSSATDTRSAFSREIMWTLAARLLMVASSVGTGLIVARWLGAEGLGAYAVLSVTITNAVQISGAGLTAANVYFIARERQNLKSASVNALIFALVAGSAIALIIIAMAALKPSLFRGLPFSLIAVNAALVPFQLIVLFGLNIFLAVGRVVRFNLLDAAGQSLILINAIFVVIIMGNGLLALISFNTAAGAVMGGLICGLVYRYAAQHDGASGWRADMRLLSRMVRYGLKYSISMTATMLVFRADVLVVNFFRGSVEAGVYSVASQGGLMLMLLPNVIGTLLFPRIASSDDVSGTVTMIVTRHTAFVMAVICLLAIPGAFALPLLYGAQFSDAPVQLLILLPGVFLVGLEMVLVQHFVGTGLPKAIPAFWVMTLICNIALNLWIVPTFGARGAALTSTLSYAIIFTLVTVHFCRQTGNRLSSLYLLRAAELRKLWTLASPGIFRN